MNWEKVIENLERDSVVVPRGGDVYFGGSPDTNLTNKRMIEALKAGLESKDT